MIILKDAQLPVILGKAMTQILDQGFLIINLNFQLIYQLLRVLGTVIYFKNILT